MHPYIERLKEELDRNPPCYGYPDANSLLEMLYLWYAEWNPINSEQIRQDFWELESCFCGCREKRIDDALDVVTRLCKNHEQLPFWRDCVWASGWPMSYNK